MNQRSIKDIEERYDLEIEKIVEKIKKKKCEKVLLQFPDGLKPYATLIVDKLEQLTGEFKPMPIFLIWMGSCFGACDIPQLGEIEKQVDLLVQFGHSEWAEDF